MICWLASPAVISNVLSLGDDSVVDVAGGAEQVVGQPVLIVLLHLGGQEVVNKLREGGDLVKSDNNDNDIDLIMIQKDSLLLN